MIKIDKHKYFLYTPLLFGIGIGLFLLLDINITIDKLLLSCLLLGVLSFYSRRYVVISLLVILLGYTCITIHSSLKSPPITKNYYSLSISGIITKLEQYPSAQRLTLENVSVVGKKWDYFPQKIRIRVNGLRNDLSLGDMITTNVNLVPPSLPIYPNSYDFSTKAWFDNIGAVGYNVGKIKVTKKPDIDLSYFERFTIFMGHVRQDISRNIRQILPDDTGKVATALVTGEQSSISKSLIQDYRDTGLAHILSVSGMHMSALALLVFVMFRSIFALFPNFAIYYDIKKISAVIALVITFLYLMISGQEIPTQRSYIMVFVVFTAILFNRRAISLRTIAIAALIIMTFSPQSVLSPGFQMSFAAVLMLVAYYEKNYLKKGKTVVSIASIYVYGIILTAFIGTISTSIYAVYHFNRFPVYSILGNLAAASVFSFIIMPALLLGVVFMGLGWQEIPLKIAGFGIDLMNDMTIWIADLPHAVLLVPQISFWVLLAITIGGYYFAVGTSRWKYLGLLPIIPLIINIATYKKPDFIINDDSTLVAINHNNNLILSPGLGNRMERNSWLNINGQYYNDVAKKDSKEFYKTICNPENKCSYQIGEYRFDFAFDKKIKPRELFVYKNNVLYQHFTKNDLRDNKTMLFYAGKNSMNIDTVKKNKTRWWK